jgi:CheY-like chemotaxis protein
MEYKNLIISSMHKFMQEYYKRSSISSYLANQKILIVEDNNELQMVFRDLLAELTCHNIDIATTGMSALSLFAKSKYALVFLDVGLPDINGIEVCKKMRQREGKMLTPIVAVTAFDMAKQDCFNAGVNDFAVKPLLFEHMQYLIARWILSKL